MDTFFYRRTDNGFVPCDLTIGPWSNRYQHGSPPFALGSMVAASQFPGLNLSHATISFVRPVSLDPISIRFLESRHTRRTAWSAYSILQNGNDVAFGTVSLAGAPNGAISLPDSLPTVPDRLVRLASCHWVSPGPPLGRDANGNQLPWINHPCGFMQSSHWKFPNGAFSSAGPGEAWWMTEASLIEGEDTPSWLLPLLLSDANWSISRRFSLEDMSAVNTGISCTLVSDPDSRELGLSSANYWSSERNGISLGHIYDRHKLVATVAQPLLLSTPRAHPVA